MRAYRCMLFVTPVAGLFSLLLVLTSFSADTSQTARRGEQSPWPHKRPSILGGGSGVRRSTAAQRRTTHDAAIAGVAQRNGNHNFVHTFYYIWCPFLCDFDAG